MQSFFHKAKIWQLIFFVDLNDNQSFYFGFKDGAGSGIPPSLGLINKRKKIELIRNSLYKYYTQLVFKYNGDLQFVKKTMFLLILMDLGYID